MEMALGQFTSRGNVKTFSSFSPAFSGIGYGQLLGSMCIATYYCSLMAITLFYLINSFTSNLPWATCKPEWEQQNMLRNITCVSSSEKESSDELNRVSSSELWFTQEVLKQKEQIEDGIGFPEWRLTLCLLVSWILTFSVSAKGVKSSGKASYFLALFPYVIMIAILIRAVTLNGAVTGILYFITPEWNKLATAEVWYAAVTQCFFSLNVGLGSIIMYSSYNDFEHNINRDALIVTTLDTFTSLLAGTTIFGILGNLAYQLDVPVKDVIKSGGTGLAFISYPDAIAKFEDVPWLSSFTWHRKYRYNGQFSKTITMEVAGTTALFGFLIGLVYITPGGQYILTVVDFFGGNMIVFIFGIIEITMIMWYYGCENLCNDIEFMTKNKVGIYWRLTWSIITPIFLIIIFIYFISTITRLSYGSYRISDIALGFGWAIVACGAVMFLVILAYNTWKKRSFGFPQMLLESIKIVKWKPAKLKHYSEWKKVKQKKAEDLATKKQSWILKKINFLVGK
ncbi:hypothetical protein FQA39_LY18987 [Lamprigera yunnana]|nr:hypothetical protein FQA39_LY18987 [Lamprigera yunnana]